MGVLQNVIREIGDIVNRLSVSSKEKQKIQEEIQSLVYRYKSELVREQSAAVGEEARGNWLQRSWRPIVMLAFALDRGKKGGQAFPDRLTVLSLKDESFPKVDRWN